MFKVSSKQQGWLEEAQQLVNHVGFCLVEDVVVPKDCTAGITALHGSYEKVLNMITKERLQRAGEEGVIRGPMSFDPFFFKLLENTKIQQISEKLVAETSILHLQNGFIFPRHDPTKELSKFQYTFHPDYPRYHNGHVSSVNVLITFTDINEEDEIFYIVPGSHHQNYKLTQEYCMRNKLSVSAKAGSVLIFDSTCWHCGGPNKSGGDWYGVNHQFSRSFMKQQIDYVRLLGNDLVLKQTDRVQQMLGYYTRVVTSLDEFYQPTEKRLYRSEQG